ncbi:MAG: Swt1 family HEPN domain-containing protein [Gammaproteobacteria bacterium]|nr:Swt1 family HEPN domain-containing protein [Gammaproteobacteria bacterium]
MAITNHERVGKALELLKAGLGPFVEREVKSAIQSRQVDAHKLQGYVEDPLLAEKSISEWDSAGLLKLMWETWNEVFRQTLGPAERGLVGELRGIRNKWAHQESFSSDDAYRALDSTERLLKAVSAPESGEVERIRLELLRTRFDEQTRGERRKQTGLALDTGATGNLKPWRDVITPHEDVASGRYQQAEFAADLSQVHKGEGAAEYREPLEFFRRTYLTDSLKKLLVNAILRLNGQGGDPVVQLQTNFGGGKTHSMLALYHLFSGVKPTDLLGMDELMQDAGADKLPQAKRVVLVGTRISPGKPDKKDDGVEVRTLWGELAWQLGGKAAWQLLDADDERATNPGDTLRVLFKQYGPCVILIDEWVAYARQLHEQSDLPGGSFDTQFSFAQALTEAAKAADNCLLVISLPASDTASHHETAEVGGMRGVEALQRLKNVIGRVESAWRPASAEEGFEIVRRRLFQPLSGNESYKYRDVVAREFSGLYQRQGQEFPSQCREADYEQRIRSAYPIHPEVFDRLYEDWSTLVHFQRTRGVLRLMAAVIHNLWEAGDKSALILPCSIAIDDGNIQRELTRYLPDNWTPIIEKDVDGAGSLPRQIDRQAPNLGKLSACRRVARTIYLGSAPGAGATHRGVDDRQVKLGCVMPGETSAPFGDALMRLANAATYLYRDGSRYWYATQPTVRKLAEDRAEQFGRDPDKVAAELADRLRADLRQTGDFGRVHPLPQSAQDVPDDWEARLVVLGVEQPYSRDAGSTAETAARAILESRGSAPRLYRNTLVFLAADQARVQELDEAVRLYLAWDSIVAEREELNLDPQQVKQAQTQRDSASATVDTRVPETWQWLLVPNQENAQQTGIRWEALRLSATDALAVRAGKRLKKDELLLDGFAGTGLRMELDKTPLWRGDHVPVKQLIEDFASYLYLPRLRDPDVLLQAVNSGLASLTWERDGFAFADSYDEVEQRYRGLQAGQIQEMELLRAGLLVKPEVARRQLDEERKANDGASGDEVGVGGDKPPIIDGPPLPGGIADGEKDQPLPRRFHGSVELDAARVGRDASQVADEVISHLSGLVGAEVTVTLEIEAKIPTGVPDNVIRTVTENSNTLKFQSHGFEKD